METPYYIIIRMKVLDGSIHYGKLFIGEDTEFARQLYDSLQGHLNPKSQLMLYMDLVKGAGNTNLPIQSKACTLEELTENCRIITRETFKFLNLEK